VREPSFTAFPVLPSWVVAGGLIAWKCGCSADRARADMSVASTFG
jgi:hypothetical protein